MIDNKIKIPAIKNINVDDRNAREILQAMRERIEKLSAGVLDLQSQVQGTANIASNTPSVINNTTVVTGGAQEVFVGTDPGLTSTYLLFEAITVDGQPTYQMKVNA